jgi:Flp pilus assembly protein TadD
MWLKRTMLQVGLLAALAPAGVIVTTDGVRLEGEIKKTPEGWNVTAADGTVTPVPSSKIRAIELNSASGANPMERLQSLRRSVEALEDVAKIIDRYKRFIEQSKDAAVTKEAEKDLAIWRDRQQKNLIKSGKEWITSAERQEQLSALYERIDATRLLIKQNQLREAEAEIAAIQELDPMNMSAAYLQGVMLAKENKVADARKAFAIVQQAAPRHAPTLHNLGVLNVKQKQWPAACALFDQALAAEPGVQVLIDHTAELLEMVPKDHQSIAAYERLAKRFAEQDAALQRVMTGKQMYRWGATWVDKAAYDKLAAAEAEVKKKITDLQADFDLTQNRINRIDEEIRLNEQTLRAIESRSTYINAEGRIVQMPLPPSYYEVQQVISKLKAEKPEMIARLETLRDTAVRTRNALPTPKFSGTIAMINEDGVPVLLPDAPPATAPATQPVPDPPFIRVGPADGL